MRTTPNITFAQYLNTRQGKLESLENSTLELSLLIQGFENRINKLLCDPHTTALRRERCEMHQRDLFVAQEQLRNLSATLRSAIDWLTTAGELLWPSTDPEGKI